MKSKTNIWMKVVASLAGSAASLASCTVDVDSQTDLEDVEETEQAVGQACDPAVGCGNPCEVCNGTTLTCVPKCSGCTNCNSSTGSCEYACGPGTTCMNNTCCPTPNNGCPAPNCWWSGPVCYCSGP